jgi:hypothetical protein
VLVGEDMHTIARIEGADWQALSAASGGLGAHLVVRATKSHRSNSRGAHNSYDPATGSAWTRWNTSKLGGYPLGPGRKMSDVRNSPWELRLDLLEDKALHAVFLDHGNAVALIDGVGTKDIDAVPVHWVLIGAVFELRQDVGCLLPQLVVPTASNTLSLSKIAMSRIWKPVLLAVNAPHEGRAGISISVVDTKDTFSMIPIIAGRMQEQAVVLKGAIEAEFLGPKRVILDVLIDIGKHMGAPPDMELVDLMFPQEEFWSSATQLQSHTLGSDNLREVRMSPSTCAFLSIGLPIVLARVAAKIGVCAIRSERV